MAYDLTWMRANFLEMSGRLDLTSSTALQDLYINTALKWLDEQTDFVFTNSSVSASVLAGASSYTVLVAFKSLRKVKLVVGTSETVLDFYDKKVFDVSDTVPDKYTIRRADDGSTSLVFNAPLLENATLVLEGDFYRSLLVNTGDVNWWTINFPLTVLHAACYTLELDRHNPEGQKDWLATINPVIANLVNRNVEQETHYINQMGG